MRAAALVLAGTALLLTSCGGGSTGASPRSTATSPTSAQPTGVLALGHSGLTGFKSDPATSGDARQNSWATGTNPAVDSIYARLLRVDPSLAGQASNQGVDGSKADALLPEAQDGLAVVPHPRLVLVQTVDNDVLCDGTDQANVPVFGAQLKAALDAVVAAEPQVTVLVLSQLGRPLEAARATLRVPDARAAAEGSGACDMIDPRGRLNLTAVQRLTEIVQGYEREVAVVCGAIPQCHTDGGLGARFTDFVDWSVPGDWNHLTVRGHARLAALVWPTVARLLSVPAT